MQHIINAQRILHRVFSQNCTKHRIHALDLWNNNCYIFFKESQVATTRKKSVSDTTYPENIISEFTKQALNLAMTFCKPVKHSTTELQETRGSLGA